MADDNDKPWTQRPVGRVVAGVLMVTCAALLARAVHGMDAEGQALCDALYAHADRLPGPRPPCSVVSTSADGGAALAEYVYGSDGEMRSVTFGGDRVSCTTWGKPLIPLVNYRRWLAHGASMEVRSQAEPYRDDEVGLFSAPTLDHETRIVRQVNPHSDRTARWVYTRNDRQGRLVQSTTYDSVVELFRIAAYRYDAGGDLVRQDRARLTRDGLVSSQVTYSYDCWE